MVVVPRTSKLTGSGLIQVDFRKSVLPPTFAVLGGTLAIFAGRYTGAAFEAIQRKGLKDPVVGFSSRRQFPIWWRRLSRRTGR